MHRMSEPDVRRVIYGWESWLWLPISILGTFNDSLEGWFEDEQNAKLYEIIRKVCTIQQSRYFYDYCVSLSNVSPSLETF